MKVFMHLYVSSELSDRVRTRWRELGGPDTAVTVGEFQTDIATEDRESTEGKALTALVEELRDDGNDIALHLTAQYDKSDAETAELLLLSVGDVHNAVDETSVVRATRCETCRLPTGPLRSKPDGPRLIGKKFGRYDLFRANRLWFASQKVVEAFHGFRGLVAKPVPGGEEAFYELTATSNLGYELKVTCWSEPCPDCGRRRGIPDKAPRDVVSAKLVYPRKAWDGSDFAFTEQYLQGLIVSRSVWSILTGSGWRTPSIEATPIQLDDDATPVF